uniref:Kinesin family member 6 n=1 Tax=Sparus aurata TaxID=8175 RepID=A0A671UDN2_SPAAU
DNQSKVYSVDNEEQIGAFLEFVVPRDLADGFVNNKRECYKFRFQKVFDQAVKQEEIFENIARPVADSILDGYNGTIFAYGQTGSGKTFTITGGAERYSDRGIIPRTLSYLYERISQGSSMVYTTHISYLEIYNEIGYDLLDSCHEASRLEDLPKVMIMEDPDQNIHLKNLSLQHSANEEEALNLLFLGDTNRMIAETPMNQASTRSHCIFTVHLCRREQGSATLRRSKLHLVDLAGSDRVSKTGLNGQLLTEAKYINLSLHYLEQVIIALSEKNRTHIPYRNSMLTSVLRDSLGGNCMTTMIATLAVEKRNLDESISTCRFAQRVALIKNEAILNEELDPTLVIARLKREVQSLKEELAMVTGEQKDDKLTVEEIQKLEELVKAFLDEPNPDVTLSLGPDMRKIQHCFSLLKVTYLQYQFLHVSTLMSPCISLCVYLRVPNSVPAGILIKMLKNEKKRAQDAAAQLAYITNSQSPASQNALMLSTLPARDGNTEIFSADPGGPAIRYMKRGPQLSIEKQEAFETFMRDHEDHLTIEDNKKLLKQRLVIPLPYKQYKLSKEEIDPVEENLCKHIEQEKKFYKTTIGRLKVLRTEIEHLQLLLERAKVKLQKDFQKWWSQEASSVQVTDHTLTTYLLPVSSRVHWESAEPD